MNLLNHICDILNCQLKQMKRIIRLDFYNSTPKLIDRLYTLAMVYAVILSEANLDPDVDRPNPSDLIFDSIKDASSALKKYVGSRMKTFDSRDKALHFLSAHEDEGESFFDCSTDFLVTSLEKLSINKEPADEVVEYESPKPAMLNQLRRAIEAGNYEKVEELIWSNPRCLITCCDSAVYIMAGPKYNACHIAARANKSLVMALLLDTVSNISFIRKLYPKESDENVKERSNHLLDSYLNTPDPRQGNTPLHFACKSGHYKIVRVLLTFEGLQLNLKDSNGMTAEESCYAQIDDGDSVTRQKIKELFKSQLHLPLHRDQLRKRLSLAKKQNQPGTSYDSDTSFSEDSFILSPIKKPQAKSRTDEVKSSAPSPNLIVNQ